MINRKKEIADAAGAVIDATYAMAEASKKLHDARLEFAEAKGIVQLAQDRLTRIQSA